MRILHMNDKNFYLYFLRAKYCVGFIITPCNDLYEKFIEEGRLCHVEGIPLNFSFLRHEDPKHSMVEISKSNNGKNYVLSLYPTNIEEFDLYEVKLPSFLMKIYNLFHG